MGREDRRSSKPQRNSRWMIDSIYNSFIISGTFLILALSLWSALNNLRKIDDYFSQLSPYAGVLDLNLDYGGTSQLLKGRIPKPIFFQLWKDVMPVLNHLRREFFIFYLEMRECMTGEESGLEDLKPQIPRQISTPKPKGNSLLFVNSFCKDLFRDKSLEECRSNLQNSCGLDILSWFNIEPNYRQVEDCVVNQFHMEAGFFNNFRSTLRAKETAPVFYRPGSKVSWKLGVLAVCLLLATGFTFLLNYVYRKMFYDNEEVRHRLRVQEVENVVENRLIRLQDHHSQTIQDPSTCCFDFNSCEGSSALEHGLYGYLTLIVLDPLPVQAVSLTEEQSGLVDPGPTPNLQYLDVSWQKSLMEEGRIGITTIHKADFDFDVNGDLEEPNEDNIYVTGLEQDKDDPLQFNYWRKRLRDVRAELSEAALDRLKRKCPTLFKMGWFEDGSKSRKPSVSSQPSQISATDQNTKEEIEMNGTDN